MAESNYLHKIIIEIKSMEENADINSNINNNINANNNNKNNTNINANNNNNNYKQYDLLNKLP